MSLKNRGSTTFAILAFVDFANQVLDAVAAACALQALNFCASCALVDSESVLSLHEREVIRRTVALALAIVDKVVNTS